MKSMNIQLNKKYSDFILNCNFSINKKITGIFGPSGSGKSTILNCISGFTKPEAGYISFKNKILYDSNNEIYLNPEKRNIGYVTQKSNLFPSMNVLDNIKYGYQDNYEIEVNDIINTMNIQDLLIRFPSELSGGQAQKISISRALASNPDILLMDEPLSELDTQSKLMILNYLKKINIRYKIPIIYVSHDISEMIALCDDVYMIEEGTLKTKITSSELSFQSNINTDFQNIYLLEGNDSKELLINGIKIKVNETVNKTQVIMMLSSSAIMISNEKSIFDVADNTLIGVLKKIKNSESIIRLFCDVGFEIVLDISKDYFDKLNLKLNDKIYVIFKSINVNISLS
jgi:molybdate transport system ATP-binding protein